MPTTLVAAIVMEFAVDWAVAQTIVYMAITFAVSTIASKFLSPNGNLNPNQPADNGARQQVPPDTTTPIPVIYGSAYVGGKFVDACLRTDGQVMYYVMAISCISEYGQFGFDTTKMYYGDRLITFDSSNHTKVVSLTDGAGNVDTKINDFLYINLYTSDKDGNITPINGTKLPWEYDAGSDGTSLLMGVGSGLATDQQWTATDRRMNGLAFAVVRLSYSRDAGTTQLQPITFHATQNLFNEGIANPGSVWYDYMKNPVYGAAVDETFLDVDSAVVLNNYSNELVTFIDYNGNPQTQPRYRINGVVDTGQSILQNVDKIMTASDSWMQYNAEKGKWGIVVNKPEATSFAFDDSNIVGSIVVGSVDIAQVPNQVEAKFPDSTNRDQWNYVYETVPSGLLYPNEPVNKQTINYDLVNNSVQALYLANRTLEQGREDLLVTINTTYNGIQVLSGDVVSITNSAYGWDNKLFRAMQVKEAINPDGMLGAQIQLIEYNAQVYDDKDITQFTPSPNSGLVSSQYFSALTAPDVTDQQPSAAVPSFSVECLLPATGRITTVTLYYTTVSSPTASDWMVLVVQNTSNSNPFTNATYLKFTHISLPTNAYYFAFIVANDVGQSKLSPISTVYNWLPTPTTTAVAGTFVATFSPAVLQVPYDGAPNFTGVIASLYGTTSGGSVDFVTAQTDSDFSFVPNSWRIGASSTGGYGDIVKTNITIGNPTDGGNYALFPQPTAMSGNPATLSVPVRYKNPDGVVEQGATAIIQYSFNIKGATGPRSSTGYLYYAYASASAPSSPSASGYDFTNNTFSSLSVGWSTSFTAPPPTTNPSTQAGSKFWAVRYSVSEATYAGTQTVTLSSPFNWQNLDGLVTFTNVAAPSGTTFIDGGNIITDTITVNALKSNTSGTFNSGTFQLGTGASVAGYPATGAFTGTASQFSLLTLNTGGVGAAVANTATGDTFPALAVFNSTSTAYTTHRTSAGIGYTTVAIAGGNTSSGFGGQIGTPSYGVYSFGPYGPFTGSHDALINKSQSIEIGDIVIDTDFCIKKSINDVITIVKYNNANNQKGALGVITNLQPSTTIPSALSIVVTNPTTGISKLEINPEYAYLLDDNNVITVNALGEGLINVCGQNGNLSIGDLIVCSNMVGKGMKQDDDIIRSYTVAKCREDVIFDSPDQVKLVACIYVSG